MIQIFKCWVGAALALLGIGGIGLAIGMAGGAGLEGIARQPEATEKISNFMLTYVILPELFLALILSVLSLYILNKCKCERDC
ncbi:hypothetical protein [Mangrovibacillus cuniculi]|uniref:ATP synthase F(0) sector subunit c n=1 Tax=Mangrovibacillus cuniculi TaxID=2593652 RepID=A0A7S8CBU1_9BACI|nr:hypothetical protein [Mangrovibacillus cuniculi]QPC47088.1 F0F1 ATP synthase subunit C [Mangrovibacillus cuniculi]